jgi:hypothetical protein
MVVNESGGRTDPLETPGLFNNISVEVARHEALLHARVNAYGHLVRGIT